MIDDLTDVGAILEDFASAYVVTRAGAVDFTTSPGRPTEAAPSTFNITAVVQPLKNTDLQRLPEGLRTEEVRKVYTKTALLLTPQPDTISIEGLTWQVEAVEAWASGAFYRAFVRKVG